MGFKIMKRDSSSHEKASTSTMSPNSKQGKTKECVDGLDSSSSSTCTCTSKSKYSSMTNQQQRLKSVSKLERERDETESKMVKKRTKSKDRSMRGQEEPTKTIRKKSREPRPKSAVDLATRKSITSLEDLIGQSPPKIKPAAEWKITSGGQKNEIKKRRNSIGPGLVNEQDRQQQTNNSEYIRRGTKPTKKLIRQGSDSDLKKKVDSKVKTSSSKLSEAIQTISLDDFLPRTKKGSSNSRGAETVHTEPLSDTRGSSPRRSLRSHRRSNDSKDKPPTSRTSSRERRLVDMERWSSSMRSIGSSFASATSYGVDDILTDTTTSVREKKLKKRLQEEEERNDSFARKVAELEKKLVVLQAENEVILAKMRRTKLDSDRVLAEKDKEINQLSDTVESVLEAELRMDSPRGSVTSDQTRLENELIQANTKLVIMEKCLSDVREMNTQLNTEIDCYRNSSKSHAMKVVDASLQKQIVDLQEKLKFKDETIDHLMDQLKQFKQSKLSIDESAHTRIPDMDRSGHGLIGSLADTMSKFSPGTLARRKVEIRTERTDVSVKSTPQLHGLF